MSQLTRDLYVPYLDLNKGEGDTYDWCRIDKSTVFEFSFNPSEETYGYIDSANDTTLITSYAATMEQEIILDNDNAMYAFMYEFCMGMPTGTSASIPALLAEPDSDGAVTRGRLWAEATVSPGSLNTVDGKLSFTINYNGTQTVGDVTYADDGTVTFTEDAEEEETTDEG